MVGGQGPPAIGANWNDAPAGHGLEGLVGHRRPGAGAAPTRWCSTRGPPSEAGYTIGEEVHLVTSGEQAVLRPTLVGIAGFPEGGSLNGATFAAFDTRDRAGAASSRARTPSPTSGSPPSRAPARRSCADSVTERLPDGVEAVTGDEAADEAASAIQEAIGFLTTFLLIFAGISLVVGAFLIVNTFSILVAQRSRELALLRALGASKRQVTRSVHGRGVRPRRRRLHHRPRARASCSRWASAPCSASSASTCPGSR